jgi:hypothetical protein
MKTPKLLCCPICRDATTYQRQVWLFLLLVVSLFFICASNPNEDDDSSSSNTPPPMPANQVRQVRRDISQSEFNAKEQLRNEARR